MKADLRIIVERYLKDDATVIKGNTTAEGFTYSVELINGNDSISIGTMGNHKIERDGSVRAYLLKRLYNKKSEHWSYKMYITLSRILSLNDSSLVALFSRKCVVEVELMRSRLIKGLTHSFLTIDSWTASGYLLNLHAFDSNNNTFSIALPGVTNILTNKQDINFKYFEHLI